MRRLCAVLLAGAVCAGLSPAQAAPLPHHTIVLNTGLAKGTVRYSDSIAVFGQRALRVEVAPWIRIGSVRVDGKPYAAAARPGGLTLFLPGWRRHQIEITAEGTVPGGEAGAHSANSAFAEKDWLYLPGSSGWMPDTGDDALSYRLTIEVEPPNRAVATGRLEAEELGMEASRSVFTAGDASEPPSVFAGPYVVAERVSGPVRLRTYFTQSTAILAREYLDTADRYIRHFTEEIGPYPFADFHIVAAPLPVGLGFPGLTYVDARILPLPFMRERSLGHETLHNWWGNGVRPDYERGNWSEGLTTYMADHNLAAARDAKDAMNMRLGWLRDYAALPAEKDMPLTRFVTRSHDASQIVGYGKAAFIFHMLKQELGEERFGTAIRRFWQDYRHRVAGWDDIRQVFEMSSGRDLKGFFDQWLTRTGAPTLTLAGARIVPDRPEVEITLRQSAPYYALIVPVEIETAAGTVRSQVVVDGAETTAAIRADARPLSVRIDPDYALFRHLLPGEAPPILRDVLLDGGARVLVASPDPAITGAARELAARLFETTPPVEPAGAGHVPEAAFMVIGKAEDISRFIAEAKLPPRPDVASENHALVWTKRRADGKAIIFVEAESADALRPLVQRLPHYRSESFVIFTGSGGVTRGVWAPSGGPLTKRFE